MKYIIFDMDGTIVDSMDYWKNISREYVMEELPDVKVPEDFDEKIISMNISECADYLNNTFGLRVLASTLFDKAIEIMNKHYASDINPKPGMIELIKEEHINGSRMVIFSNSPRECIEVVVNRFGIKDCIEMIFTSEDIPYKKSSKDAYIEVAKRAGFITGTEKNFDNIYVYEDVLHGITSAKEAGFYAIAVYDKASEHNWNQIKESADNYIKY